MFKVVGKILKTGGKHLTPVLRPSDIFSSLTLWYKLSSLSDVVLNFQAQTGTVSTTAGSATVTGSGTAFTSADVGKRIRVGSEDRWVSAYSSSTSITVNEAFTSNNSGATWYFATVSQWNDSSGGSHHATQSTAASQPFIYYSAATGKLSLNGGRLNIPDFTLPDNFTYYLLLQRPSFYNDYTEYISITNGFNTIASQLRHITLRVIPGQLLDVCTKTPGAGISVNWASTANKNYLVKTSRAGGTTFNNQLNFGNDKSLVNSNFTGSLGISTSVSGQTTSYINCTAPFYEFLIIPKIESATEIEHINKYFLLKKLL